MRPYQLKFQNSFAELRCSARLDRRWFVWDTTRDITTVRSVSCGVSREKNPQLSRPSQRIWVPHPCPHQRTGWELESHRFVFSICSACASDVPHPCPHQRTGWELE